MNFEEELRKLKDAMTVEMVLSERYRTRQQQHQAWIEANEAAIAQHREILAQHDAMMAKIDEHLEEIARLLKGKLRGENGNQ